MITTIGIHAKTKSAQFSEVERTTTHMTIQFLSLPSSFMWFFVCEIPLLLVTRFELDTL